MDYRLNPHLCPQRELAAFSPRFVLKQLLDTFRPWSFTGSGAFLIDLSQQCTPLLRFMTTTHVLVLRTDPPAPGQLELLPGCGDRGTLYAKARFHIEPALNADSNSFAEVTVTGRLGAASAPPPPCWDDPDPADPEIIYCFEEESALEEARAYWSQLLSLGFRPE